MIRSALLRTRYVLFRHGAVIAAVLVVAGVLAVAGAGWLYTHPPTTEVTDETQRQTIESTVSTQAQVRADSAMYESGQTLRNEPVYLRAAAPSSAVVLTTSVPPDERTTVEQRLVVEYRVDHDGETFWENTTVVDRNTETTRSGDVRLAARLDPAAIQNRTREIERRVGDAGTVHVRLRMVVSYETTHYNGSFSRPVDLQVADRWYSVGTPSVSRTHSTPETRTVDVPTRNRWLHVGLGSLGGLALLSGLGLAGMVRVTGRRLSRSELERHIHELRYDAWISTGTLDEDLGEQVVTVASLEDLVDIGIDTDNRIIHDPTDDRYAIVDGVTVYQFDQP